MQPRCAVFALRCGRVFLAPLAGRAARR